MHPARHPRPRLRPLYFAAAFAGLSVAALEAEATLPLPAYPECGKDNTAAACPPDLSRSDGTLAGDAWAGISWIPEEAKGIRRQEQAMGSGSASTTAWRLTTGRTDVTIAILDCGIRWRESSLRAKVRLHTGELPLPLKADGTACASYDCDGNGIVNADDYADDSRVFEGAGRDEADGSLDASDLIYTFSDGIDGDNDGYIDNIAGWDFMWDDNDPYTTNDFYHGSSVMEEAAGEGGEPDSAIGHCPNCAVMPVRISDSFVGEGDSIAEGIIYAVDHGANVIGMALGSMTNPSVLQSAMLYAWDHDVTIVAAAGDELGYHHNYPGANDHALYMHSIKYYPTIDVETARSFLGFFGCNNFGARLDGVAASGACATGSVAATAGMAGLVYSRGWDMGIDLTASEVRQILLRTVDDINVPESQMAGSPYFPSHAGWDYFFGHGRINSGRAISSIGYSTIPPEIRVDGPGWFSYFDPRVTSTLTVSGEVAARRAASYGYEVEWAAGVDPADNAFHQLTDRTGLTAPTTGTLATLDLNSIDPAELDAAAPIETLDGGDTIEDRADKVNAKSITLRIRVTDASGNRAEERRQVFIVEDPDLLAGFPIKLGYSGESSVVLYDLDGNGSQEIVLATANGIVHAYRSSGAELTGWPVKVALETQLDPSNPKNHLKGKAWASGAISSDVRQGIVGAPAVGDLDGDGKAEVVVATLEGRVFAFGVDGKLKTGFPVTRDPVSDNQTNSYIWMDPGMFSSTVLYDLDNDGKLEIVQASMDQKIYVWRYDGQRQPGFPVKVENPDGSTGTSTKAGRIVSSPAIGDLDGDGSADIVVGTNEYADDATWQGYAYAIHGDGTLNPEGPVMPGWPVVLYGLLSGVINYVGEGLTASPSIADVDRDGQMEVLLSGVGGCPKLLSYDGSEFAQMACPGRNFGRGSNSNDAYYLSVISNGAFADLNDDGAIEAFMPGSGLSYFISLGISRYMKFDHLLGVWKSRTGEMLEAFPRVIEDISFFNGPSAADVNGDGAPEMLVGSSGYILHAFKEDGTEPPGWPKFTGGWLISGPAVGDVDGDGKNEVVQVTREGYLFAWNTSGVGGLEWPTFRHDPQNTGNYHTVPETRALVGDASREAASRVSASGSTAGAAAGGLAAADATHAECTASCSVAGGTVGVTAGAGGSTPSGRGAGAGLVGLLGLSLGVAALRRRR